jgi:hypothetical protein
MRNKFARKVSMWIFAVAVIAGLGYSALVLAARPAYADTVCEPEDCTIVRQQIAQPFCSDRGGVKYVICPDPGSPDLWFVFCEDGTEINGNCSSF